MGDLDDVCVVPQPISTGSQQHVLALLQIIRELTSVSLITANLPSDSPIRDEYEFVEIAARGTGDTIPTAAIRFVYNQFRMALELSRREESVVLFFGTTSYFVPILVSKISGKTVILEPRGDVPLTLQIQWERRVPSPIARLLAGSVRLLESIGYRLADRIVTYTPSMAKQLELDRYGYKLYPHGARYIDTERFSIQTPCQKRDDIVGFVGRLDEEKGIRELAEVAKRLPKDVTFRFVGDGPLYEWLKSELDAEIQRGEVELAGWVDYDEVPAELNRLKLLVMPSHPTEGLPTTILEALACGTPVYATPVAGVPDVVLEGETGFLITNTQPQQIAQSIISIVADDDLARMSEDSRRLAVTEYGFEAAVRRYEELFSEV